MASDLERIVERLAQQSRTRHYGKYRGLVTDIADPENLCRVRAEVPAVYGEQESPWALPALPYAGQSQGFVMLPEVGTGVWIEFEAGDIARPIWSGCWFANDQRPDPQGDRVRVIVTGSGHQIVLDEESDEIKLVHPGGAELTMSASEIVLKLGASELKLTTNEISLNNGMVKVTTAGVSLVNDAMKFGA